MSCSRVQNCCESSKEKTVLRGSEVEELNERLRILEEETETMKEALFWSMEERKNMITQIYRQFELLHPCQSPRNLVIGESSFEDRRVRSLSVILCPNQNPSLVTRDLRANVFAFQEPAEETNLLLLSDR